MFYLGHICTHKHVYHSLGTGSGAWSGLGGGVVDGSRGWKHLIYCIYTIQYSICIIHSVGSVTKAKPRCSCDEPSSEAVMYPVSLLLLSLDILLSLCPPACSPFCLHTWRGNSVAPKGSSHVASLPSPACCNFAFMNVLLPSTRKFGHLTLPLTPVQ